MRWANVTEKFQLLPERRHHCETLTTYTQFTGNVRIVTFYGRPLSVSGRPCYILPMFFLFIYFLYGRLILRPWFTEVRENFTRGGP